MKTHNSSETEEGKVIAYNHKMRLTTNYPKYNHIYVVDCDVH